MKSKLQKAIRDIQESGDLKATRSFTYHSRDKKKIATAEVLFTQQEGLRLHLKESGGFNKQYINQKFRSEFNALLTGGLKNAGLEDTIYTKFFADHDFTVAQRVTLPAGTYFYSVNDGVVICDGNRLNRDFIGSYIKNSTATCSAGGATMFYSVFKLIEHA